MSKSFSRRISVRPERGIYTVDLYSRLGEKVACLYIYVPPEVDPSKPVNLIFRGVNMSSENEEPLTTVGHRWASDMADAYYSQGGITVLVSPTDKLNNLLSFKVVAKELSNYLSYQKIFENKEFNIFAHSMSSLLLPHALINNFFHRNVHEHISSISLLAPIDLSSVLKMFIGDDDILGFVKSKINSETRLNSVMIDLGFYKVRLFDLLASIPEVRAGIDGWNLPDYFKLSPIVEAGQIHLPIQLLDLIPEGTKLQLFLPESDLFASELKSDSLFPEGVDGTLGEKDVDVVYLPGASHDLLRTPRMRTSLKFLRTIFGIPFKGLLEVKSSRVGLSTNRAQKVHFTTQLGSNDDFSSSLPRLAASCGSDRNLKPSR